MLLFSSAAGPRQRRPQPAVAALTEMAARYSAKYGTPLSVSWKRDASMAWRIIREWAEPASRHSCPPEGLLVLAWELFLSDPHHEKARHPLPVFWKARQTYLTAAVDRLRGIALADAIPASTGLDERRPSWLDL